MSDTPLIFLVDDDGDFLELEKRILMGGGYATVCFSDPREALSAMTAGGAGRPDLVVTDLMMMTMDSGFTLARAVKSDPQCAGIPVIIITAVGSQRGFDFHPRTADDLSAMSADAFFDKPVAPDALLAKVRELLG
jgi:CheY-like chemotaxis protein